MEEISMSSYNPDRWVILEFTTDGDIPIRKILSGWYGGFAGADTWRLSSGITAVHDKGTFYEIENESGSVYTCVKSCYGMSSYSASIYSGFVEKLKDTKTSIKLIEESEL